jgi:DNA-binding response OmpR family regulator
LISSKALQAKNAASPLVIALVEDDRLLREEIVIHLQAHGFVVHAVNSAAALDDVMAREAIDLYVIDLNLPGESGLSLSRRLRQSLPAAGIVIMTARVALQDRISGYQDGGADIYLTKPTAPDELVLILMSLGRRVKKAVGSDEWSLRLRDRTLWGPHPGQKLRLTHREKTLLLALIQAKGRTLSSAVLCDLYGDDESDQMMSKHALEELVARLRKKFKEVQTEDEEAAIKSVWGQGYELCLPINLA